MIFEKNRLKWILGGFFFINVDQFFFFFLEKLRRDIDLILFASWSSQNLCCIKNFMIQKEVGRYLVSVFLEKKKNWSTFIKKSTLADLELEITREWTLSFFRFNHSSYVRLLLFLFELFIYLFVRLDFRRLPPWLQAH